jgi:hypothetical protein
VHLNAPLVHRPYRVNPGIHRRAELMSEGAGLLLSVRGEARRMVAPDNAQVDVTIAVSRGSKAEAARAAAAGLDGLTADLAALGGVALEAATGRRPLTWSAQSMATYAERAHDQDTGQYEPTGQVIAAVAVVVAVRAFELLDALGAVLAGRETVTVQGSPGTSTGTIPPGRGCAPTRSRPLSARTAITLPRSEGRCAAWSTSPTPGSSAETTGSPGSPAAG